MGTGPVADAFFLAFQIPNLFRRLLGEGALSSAFIPVFKETERKEGVAAAWRVGLACTWAVFLACTAICLVLLGAVSLVLWYSNSKSNVYFHIDIHTELMFQLMRWMLPYLPLVCVAAGFIGMLNARNHFFLPALGATMLNVAMLASVWWLTPYFGTQLHTQIFALAVGVVVAGVAQAAFQIPSLVSEGFQFRWLSPWKEPAVREVARRMGPSVIGVAAFQINTVLCQSFAYTHGREIISSFNYAVRLMELPQGVVGISLATVSRVPFDPDRGAPATPIPDPAATDSPANSLRTDRSTALRTGRIQGGFHRSGDPHDAVPQPELDGFLTQQRSGSGLLRSRRHQNTDAH